MRLPLRATSRRTETPHANVHHPAKVTRRRLAHIARHYRLRREHGGGRFPERAGSDRPRHFGRLLHDHRRDRHSQHARRHRRHGRRRRGIGRRGRGGPGDDALHRQRGQRHAPRQLAHLDRVDPGDRQRDVQLHHHQLRLRRQQRGHRGQGARRALDGRPGRRHVRSTQSQGCGRRSTRPCKRSTASSRWTATAWSRRT